MEDKDYSAAPLWKKLGIKQGSRVTVVGAPAHFRTVLGALPGGANIATRPGRRADVVIAFETRSAGLRKRVETLARALDPAGGLWVAYPKKTSAIETDLTFEAVQKTGLAAGLVDNKS